MPEIAKGGQFQFAGKTARREEYIFKFIFLSAFQPYRLLKKRGGLQFNLPFYQFAHSLVAQPLLSSYF